MEHHDVVVECERYALDKCRDEVIGSTNSRFTPISDHSHSYTPVNHIYTLPSAPVNGEENTFWSPSMIVSPHSPTPLQTPVYDVRSTPSTPGNNRTRTTPPEAAVEATPETTPVKVNIYLMSFINFNFYWVFYISILRNYYFH